MKIENRLENPLLRVLSRTFLGEETYITYPHNNAFVRGGESLVYIQRTEDMLKLWEKNLRNGEATYLADIGPRHPGDSMAWYDVALDARRLAVVFGNQARILDIENPREWKDVYKSPATARLDGLCSLSKDGSRLLLQESSGEVQKAIEVDLTSGRHRELFSMNWNANHFHYCPYDENWVAFSHEGPTEKIPDRCWIWHAENAPKGKVAFDQASEDPDGKLLCVGHERWGFHDVSAYVPAYAVSPAGRRGLYEIFADGRAARLRWESDVLWHCNMDPSGRFVAVDTTGPFREEMLTKENFHKYRNRHLQTDQTRGRNTSDVVLLDLETHRSLLIATVERAQHPYHPHPAISPDRSQVIWNDSQQGRCGGWVATVSVD